MGELRLRRGGLSVLLVLFALATHARAVVIATSPVENRGNLPDAELMTDSTAGYGRVNYGFSIGTFEVTNAQYVEFLNFVDPAGSNDLGLYHPSMNSDANGGIRFFSAAGPGMKYVSKAGRANQPATWVSWYDAIRFANWMHNGQGVGSTETGSYTLLGGTPVPANSDFIVRNPNATWVLPSEDEWYKAAYHRNDGDTANYWDYPTQTDNTPYSAMAPGLGSPVPAHTANFYKSDSTFNSYDNGYAVTGSTGQIGGTNYLYPVGSYALTLGPYGTFDQAGNVSEWNETLTSPNNRGIRGGDWGSTAALLRSNLRAFAVPTAGGPGLGFRLVLVPEPSTLLLAAAVFGGVVARHTKRRAGRIT
jgi:formylglycine-generating enzyme required for sulfatase activity